MSIFDNSSDPRFSRTTVFLVVDDFETMLKVTVNQLRQLGADKILTAKNGAEALRLLHSHRVDVVLSDWNMPVMSGLELLQAMRADALFAAIPFLMITAEAERSRIETAVACGVTSMLLKPYTPSQLMARVEKAIAWCPLGEYDDDIQPTLAGPLMESAHWDASVSSVLGDSEALLSRNEEPPFGLETGPQPTILLVDDSPDNLLLLCNALKSDFRIRLSQNGTKALEICYSDDPPDMVLLDIMMPDIDGFEVARRMRKHPTAKDIPVIFVSGMLSTDARMKGLDLGAVDFITKPIDPGVLKLRVRNFMHFAQINRDLLSDYDVLLGAAQLRDDVEHITRHDMKGPLAAVIGLVQSLIDDESVGRKQMSQLRMVEETALQVLNMINLSTELFKIETGRFVLQAVPVKVGDILRRIVDIDRATYSEKNLTLDVLIDGPLSVDQMESEGDAMLCYSLFQNLLRNACEAAPNGSRVSVTLMDQVPLRIVIGNSGAVPQDIRSRFFEKFVTSGKSGGTGLGTYSARLLTEAQGGSIALEVVDDTNTTLVTVVLPRANPHAAILRGPI